MDMNKFFMECLSRAFYSAWAAISDEVHKIVSDITDNIIIEICMDDNRLSTYCGIEDKEAVLQFYSLGQESQLSIGKIIVQGWV